MTSRVFIGLGSNLEQPRQQVLRAIEELNSVAHTQVVGTSSWYESEPIGPAQPNFINGVAELCTTLEPETLLDALQDIEQAHQRIRKEHWGPRTLDLDILLWDDRIIVSERLTIPHVFLKERNFVLLPLLEIAPSLTLPCGSLLIELAESCDKQSIQKLPSSP